MAAVDMEALIDPAVARGMNISVSAGCNVKPD
jgi:hypothetical protein